MNLVIQSQNNKGGLVLAAYLKLKQLYDLLDNTLFEEFDPFRFLKHIIPEIKNAKIKYTCSKNDFIRTIKDILIDPTMGDDSQKSMKTKTSVFFRGGGKTERDSLTDTTRRQLAQLLTSEVISLQCDHLRNNIFYDGTPLNEKLEHLVECICFTESTIIIDDTEILIGEEAVRLLQCSTADMCDKFCILMLCAVFQKQFMLVEEAVSGYLEGASMPHDELAIMKRLPELRRDELLQRIVSEIRNPKRQLILLNGELGIGKTTFIENNLSYELEKIGYKVFNVNYEHSFFYSIVNNFEIESYSELNKDEQTVFAEKLSILSSLAAAKRRLIVIVNDFDGERIGSMLSDTNEYLAEIKKAVPKLVLITSQRVDNPTKMKYYTDTAEPFSEHTLTGLFRDISGISAGCEEQISHLLTAIGFNTFLTVLSASYVGADDMMDTSEKLDVIKHLSSMFADANYDKMLLNEQLDMSISCGRYSNSETILGYLQRLYKLSVVEAHKEHLYKISFLSGGRLALSLLTRLLGKTDSVKRALNDLIQFRWIKAEEFKGKKYISIPAAAAVVIQQETAADMTAFVERLCEICMQMYSTDDPDAADIARLAENCIESEYFKRNENSHMRLKLIQRVALLQGRSSSFCRMKRYEDEAITILESGSVKDNTMLGRMYNSACVTRIRMGKFTQALEYVDKAISLADMSDMQYVSALYNNKSSILLKLYRFDEAEEFCQKALKLRKQIGNKQTLAKSYHNLSDILISMGEYERSVAAADDALSFYEEDKLGKINVILLKARCVCRLKTPSSADELITQAQNIAAYFDEKHIVHANIYQTIADIAQAQGKLGAAIINLKKANEILSAHNKYVIDGVETDTRFLSSRELSINSRIHQLNYISSGGIGVFIMQQELTNTAYCLEKLNGESEVVIDVPVCDESIMESARKVASEFNGVVKIHATKDVFNHLSINRAELMD